VQVDPIKPTLKAPGTKRLKLKYDELLSNFAFDFNLRRYNEAITSLPDYTVQAWGIPIDATKVGRCRLTHSTPR